MIARTSTIIDIVITEDIERQKLCTLKLSDEQAEQFRSAVSVFMCMEKYR